MTENKRFLLEPGNYGLEYEFRIADLSRVEKTKEDFWNEKAECYMYVEFLNYLYGHNAFLTREDADIVLNELYNENEELKSKLSDYRKENYGLLDGLAFKDEVEIPKLSERISDLEYENEQLKSELSETKEILHSIEKDRNQTLLICKKYEGFFKEKGYDIQDLIDYARDGSND